jgi:hypothetical protein
METRYRGFASEDDGRMDPRIREIQVDAGISDS